jgi:hypothetical protein
VQLCSAVRRRHVSPAWQGPSAWQHSTAQHCWHARQLTLCHVVQHSAARKTADTVPCSTAQRRQLTLCHAVQLVPKAKNQSAAPHLVDGFAELACLQGPCIGMFTPWLYDLQIRVVIVPHKHYCAATDISKSVQQVDLRPWPASKVVARACAVAAVHKPDAPCKQQSMSSSLRA